MHIRLRVFFYIVIFDMLLVPHLYPVKSRINGRGWGRRKRIRIPLYVVTRFVLASRSLATSIRAFNDGIKIQDNRCFEQSSVMILVDWPGLATSFPSYALGILKLRFHSDNA